MRFLIMIFFSICGLNCILAQDLVIPIEGVYGDDYIIVNYPDWHIDDGPVLVEDGFLRDHKCGTKTYDGHQGTDFVIRGFTQMDAGVNVLSVADGEIIHVTEDLYDRETDGIVEYGLGNYVGIYHAGTNTYSYYAHLKTNSVSVEVGDFVVAGQIIAEVGSSGNSTDPHLHFEYWNPGLLSDPTIDPWGAPCDEASNLWVSSPGYDTSFAVWECGFVNYDSLENFVPSTWYPLKERLDQKSSFTSEDPFFTFWTLHYGLKMGDSTTIEWYEPNGELYATSSTYYTTQDWWFHYYSNAIVRPPLSKQGIWNVKYYYNDSLQLTKSIAFGNVGIFEGGDEVLSPIVYRIDSQTLKVVMPNFSSSVKCDVHTLSGQLILTEDFKQQSEFLLDLPTELETGLYLISVHTPENSNTVKMRLD